MATAAEGDEVVDREAERVNDDGEDGDEEKELIGLVVALHATRTHSIVREHILL